MPPHRWNDRGLGKGEIPPVQDQEYSLVPILNRRGQRINEAIVDFADRDFIEAHGPWRLQKTPSELSFYAITYSFGKQLRGMHRVLLGLQPGDRRRVDHRNRNGLDNRRMNLRFATHAENMQNRPSVAGSSSQFRSVYYEGRKNRWRACVQVNNIRYRLGTHETELGAADAVAEFLVTNVPFAEPDPAWVRARS